MKILSPFIVVIAAVQEDCGALHDILGHLERDVISFTTLREAAGVLGRASVVLCDAELPDGGWRDVMRSLGTMADPPLLIVAARVADDRLWAEVLNEGGHDVLAKPFRAPEVLHSIVSGCRWRETHEAEGQERKSRCAS